MGWESLNQPDALRPNVLKTKAPKPSFKLNKTQKRECGWNTSFPAEYGLVSLASDFKTTLSYTQLKQKELQQQKQVRTPATETGGDGCCTRSSCARVRVKSPMPTDPQDEIRIIKAILIREGLVTRLKGTTQKLRIGDHSSLHHGPDGSSVLTLLLLTREASLAVIEAIVRWYQTLAVPRPYIWNGRSYVHRMLDDLNFLGHVDVMAEALGVAPRSMVRNPFMMPTSIADRDLESFRCMVHPPPTKPAKRLPVKRNAHGQQQPTILTVQSMSVSHVELEALSAIETPPQVVALIAATVLILLTPGDLVPKDVSWTTSRTILSNGREFLRTLHALSTGPPVADFKLRVHPDSTRCTLHDPAMADERDRSDLAASLDEDTLAPSSSAAPARIEPEVLVVHASTDGIDERILYSGTWTYRGLTYFVTFFLAAPTTLRLKLFEPQSAIETQATMTAGEIHQLFGDTATQYVQGPSLATRTTTDVLAACAWIELCQLILNQLDHVMAPHEMDGTRCADDEAELWDALSTPRDASPLRPTPEDIHGAAVTIQCATRQKQSRERVRRMRASRKAPPYRQKAPTLFMTGAQLHKLETQPSMTQKPSPPLPVRVAGARSVVNLALEYQSPKTRTHSLQHHRSLVDMQANYGVDVEPEWKEIEAHAVVYPYRVAMPCDMSNCLARHQVCVAPAALERPTTPRRVMAFEASTSIVPLPEAAAVRIQCMARRYTATKVVQARRESQSQRILSIQQHNAALQIQCMTRQTLARKKVNLRRVQANGGANEYVEAMEAVVDDMLGPDKPSNGLAAPAIGEVDNMPTDIRHDSKDAASTSVVTPPSIEFPAPNDLEPSTATSAHVRLVGAVHEVDDANVWILDGAPSPLLRAEAVTSKPDTEFGREINGIGADDIATTPAIEAPTGSICAIDPTSTKAKVVDGALTAIPERAAPDPSATGVPTTVLSKSTDITFDMASIVDVHAARNDLRCLDISIASKSDPEELSPLQAQRAAPMQASLEPIHHEAAALDDGQCVNSRSHRSDEPMAENIGGAGRAQERPVEPTTVPPLHGVEAIVFPVGSIVHASPSTDESPITPPDPTYANEFDDGFVLNSGRSSEPDPTVHVPVVFTSKTRLSTLDDL
ncbi:hypothetical protein DYB32_003099 [Aphanomyces invadans]|uniref:Dynein heavy chain coiled coil stalk domain-containing protein n=1 Tax=Aphanomyces invadans TaxID=157072 RepID=A0A418B1H0_9STRA|nr:hypothetical protein DYB32_003099 [Aphanomyces invadans]